MDIAVWIIVGIGAVVAVEGVLMRIHVLRKIDDAAHEVPIDERTGLLDHRAFDTRTAGELKRLDRMPGHHFWLSVWVVASEDADAFGSAAAQSLEFPELGFRLDDTTYCFARVVDAPGASPDIAHRLASLAATNPVHRAAVTVADTDQPLRPIVVATRARALDGGGS